MSNKRERVSWSNMIYRCTTEDRKGAEHYIGKGITVYPEWEKSFESFLSYIGPKPDGRRWSVERKDVNGNYEPGNVEWALPETQNRNRTKFKNNKTGVNGITRRERKGNIRYIARWYNLDGKSLSKSFLESKYENAFEEACNHRKLMIQGLIESGADYNENHGR